MTFAASHTEWTLPPKRRAPRWRGGPVRNFDWDLSLVCKLRRLVHEGNIGEARRLLAALDEGERASPAVARWERALSRGAVRRSSATAAPGFEANQAWLAAHAAEHLGCWVALCKGRLLDSDPDYGALRSRLDPAMVREALFVRIAEG